MGEQRIEAALREATDTQNVNIGAGALTSVPDVFRESFGDSSAVVVADGNTFEAAGKEVQRRLEGAGHTMIEPYVFPAEPPLYAEYSNIEKLRGSLREHDAIPVAVGSGTINDIVKRSAHECERPYMCVATAAGCPTGPVEIELRWEDFEAKYSRARTIRKRYTVLDLAFETGILEECVGELFVPDGFWGRVAASHTRADGTRLVGSIRSDVREKHDDR